MKINELELLKKQKRGAGAPLLLTDKLTDYMMLPTKPVAASPSEPIMAVSTAMMTEIHHFTEG